jgi:hypothetical protein
LLGWGIAKKQKMGWMEASIPAKGTEWYGHFGSKTQLDPNKLTVFVSEVGRRLNVILRGVVVR